MDRLRPCLATQAPSVPEPPAPKIGAMSEEAGPDEGSTAQPGDEIASSSPHADIVERLLA